MNIKQSGEYVDKKIKLWEMQRLRRMEKRKRNINSK